MEEPTREDYEQAELIHRVEPLKSNNKGGSMINKIVINCIDKPTETILINKKDK